MIKQLVFATEEELKTKVMITIIGGILGLLLLWFTDLGIIFIGLTYMWGWSVIKSWFGITAFATIFSGGLLRSIFIVMVFFIIAAFVGALYGSIGCIRYAYLMYKKYNSRQEE